MKQISAALAAHLQGEVTTLAHCWKVTRRDGVVMGFTDHDVDIIYDAVTYQAQAGFTPTALQTSATLAVDNLDIEGLLDAACIREEDLLAGLYDFAEVDVFLINYTDLTQGRMVLRTGWLGQVSVSQGQFVAELRGLTQRLSQTVGQLYSPTCRAMLGDAACGVNLAGYTHSGQVSAATSRSQFTDSANTQASGYFAYGKVTFTSGANAGLSMEVKQFANGSFTLILPLPHAIAAGDDYTAIAGCDKRFSTCAATFDNAVNFRGEPHVPGLDAMMQTASTRSETD